MRSVAAAIFHRPWGDSVGERLVRDGRRAATSDLVRTLKEAEVHPHLILAPSDRDAEWLADLGVDVFETSDQASFDFGRTLKEFLREVDPDGLLYFGSGSGCLLGQALLDALGRFARRDEPGAVLNNFYSCDFAAVAKAHLLLEKALPEIDNPLGFALADAGIPCSALERSAETQFDIDTPTDVLILAASGRGGPAVRAHVESLEISHPPLDAILPLLTERTAHLCLVGRVNPRTWADIEPRIACRTSGLVEGRGMRSQRMPRETFLQHVLKEGGPFTLFERLSHAYDAAIIDSRVLLAEGGRMPSANVRFASDLYRIEDIEDPAWRAFTEAAEEASIPILLGGHSAVSGGLYLLAEACWKGRNRVRRLHPDPFDLDKERS